MDTPWGQADAQGFVAEGIDWVSTPRHGGYRLSRARQQQLPPYAGFRNATCGLTWWEEDCDWAVLYVVFADEFRAYYARQGLPQFDATLAHARTLVAKYHPELHEELTQAGLCRPTLFEEG